MNRSVAAVLLMLAAALVAPGTARGGQAIHPEGLQLLSSSASGITLELLTPDYEVHRRAADGQVYDVLNVAGYGATSEPGKPQLPTRAVLLGVPHAVRLSLEVTVLDEGQPARGLRVLPVSSQPRGRVLDAAAKASSLGSGQHLAAEDMANSSAAALYPAQIGRITDDATMRGQRIVRLALHPFQVDAERDLLLHHRKLRVTLRFHSDPGWSDAAVGDAPDSSFDSVFRAMLLNYDSAKEWRRSPGLLAPPHAGARATTESSMIKLQVTEDGIYRLSHADLEGVGLPVDTLDPRSLRIHHRDQELSIYVSGEVNGSFDGTDAVWFFGQAGEGKYSGINVYWLSFGEGDGKRMAERDVSPDAGSTPDSFATTARFEENQLYISDLPHAEADHWYWRGYRAGSVPTQTFTVTLDSVASTSHTAVLRPKVWGYSLDIANPDHRLDLFVNGTPIGEAAWDGYAAFAGELPFDQGLLVSGSNTVTIAAPGDTGAVWEEGYVDWFEIDYHREYEATGEWLAFDGDAAPT